MSEKFGEFNNSEEKFEKIEEENEEWEGISITNINQKSLFDIRNLFLDWLEEKKLLIGKKGEISIHPLEDDMGEIKKTLFSGGYYEWLVSGGLYKLMISRYGFKPSFDNSAQQDAEMIVLFEAMPNIKKDSEIYKGYANYISSDSVFFKEKYFESAKEYKKRLEKGKTFSEIIKAYFLKEKIAVKVNAKFGWRATDEKSS